MPQNAIGRSAKMQSDASRKHSTESQNWSARDVSRQPTPSSALYALLTVTLALVLLSLTACATPRVVTETETVTVEVERLVPVTPELTYAQEPPTRPLEIWIDALVLMIEYRHRWESCEMRMEEIRGLRDGLD